MNRFLQYTKRNIRRTPYQAIAASMVMFLTFLALTIFLVLGISSQKILVYFEQKPQVIAFFKENTTDSDVTAISQALRQSGKVASLRYVNKEEALKIYRQRNQNDPRMLELVTASYLPTSLEISANTPSDLPLIAQIIKKEPVVDDVLFPSDVVDKLTQTTNLIRSVGLTIVGFLMLFSTLIIVMIIGFKIRVRRDEIEIMKLLGASMAFIRAPFLFEGVFYAVLGAFLAWAVTFSLIWYFEPLLRTSLGEVSPLLFPLNLIFTLLILAAEGLIAAFLGLSGSYVAVRRYLKV